MGAVLLDPGLLAFLRDLNKAQLFERIRLITLWSQVGGEHRWIKLCIPPDTTEFLKRNDLIPAHTPVAELLQKRGLHNFYSPEDVIRPLYDLLQRGEQTEFCCVRDEYHEEFSSQPPQPWHPSKEADDMSQRALILSHVERELHGDGNRFRMFASVLPAGAVRYEARVEVVEPDQLPSFTALELPKAIQSEAVQVSSFEDVCSGLRPEDVCRWATSAAQIKIAIKLKCRERMIENRSYVGFGAIPDFYVGGDFFSSLVSWNASGDHPFAITTLDACAAAVLKLPTLQIKEFRKARRHVDHALPLRAHVSKRGVGLRLMMWLRQCSSATCIEFANVGGKQEESISYCDPSEAV